MERAKKLLLSTSLSLADIAEQSGYGDYRVFTKVFKKSESIAPPSTGGIFWTRRREPSHDTGEGGAGRALPPTAEKSVQRHSGGLIWNG